MGQKKSLEVLKASAGTGKTYNLARKYISLLLSDADPEAYRGILAVTFTNAATEEMKSRILKELHVMATDPSASDYHDFFVPSVIPDDRMLKKKARVVLERILHDYGVFNVSTIDRFFQQTLRAFARELGQFVAYKVELDRKALVEESVDRVLDSVEEADSELVKWLKDSVMENVEDGSNYHLESSLKEVAMRLMTDEYKALAREHGIDEKVFLKENLNVLKKRLRTFRKDYADKVSAAADDVLRAFGTAGVSPEETSRHFMAAVRKYAGAEKDIEPPTEAFMERASDYSQWWKKSDARKYSGLESVLMPPVSAFQALFGDAYRSFKTAGEMMANLNELGIAVDLKHNFEALLKEKGVLSIEDSDDLLRQIIDGSDAPFVYEKTGVRLKHFLLDEFQDTSRVQMENFAPLVRNSIAEGGNNLIVGDVKQSIYRWRGADWRLMHSGLPAFFGEGNIDWKALGRNFRSLHGLVDFNNRFFDFASGKLDAMNPDAAADVDIHDIYQGDGAVAAAFADKAEGSVEAVFCPKDEEPAKVLETVRRVHDEQHAEYGDITVLVRTNREGSIVAGHLSENGISVISNDSLHLKSSVTVRTAMALLTRLDNPGDRIGTWYARDFDIDNERFDNHSLMELCEMVLRYVSVQFPETFEREGQYIQSFMDTVRDFVASDGNELHAFLEYWKGEDPVISSPEDRNSVRIMTIHKAKGLEFEYVVFPFVESVTYSGSRKKEKAWFCAPESAEGLSFVGNMAFDLNLSEKHCRNTYFESDYYRNLKYQYIDNLNIMYVALTRAKRGMTLIAREESKGDFGVMLKDYVNDPASGFSGEDGRYMKGSLYDFSVLERKAREAAGIISGYKSWPLNPDAGDEAEDVREKGRLKFSSDAVDFFSTEGEAGYESSNRLRGIVLHEIMAKVNAPDDLDHEVENQYLTGNIDSIAREGTLALLRSAIENERVRGWFPEDGRGVSKERPVIAADGNVYRPDRVVTRPDGTDIIDYKFGASRPEYRRQIEKYVGLYRSMGFFNVHGYLWYVAEKRVEKII